MSSREPMSTAEALMFAVSIARVLRGLCFSIFNNPVAVKCSGKFGQRAKMYPTRTNGYENDKATELFRQV
jgi:hypothetical protein